MAFPGITHFVDFLEKRSELIRIKDFVNPELEITEITDRISKLPGGGKALLFENTGTRFPLLINALGSEKRMALAFGRDDLKSIEVEIMALFQNLTSPKANLWDKLKMLPQLKEVSSWMPVKVKGRVQRAECRGQGAEGRGRGRGQRAGGREQRAESRGQRAVGRENRNRARIGDGRA